MDKSLLVSAVISVLLTGQYHAYSPTCGPEWTIQGTRYCYRFSNVRLTWDDAHKECQKMDSVLLRAYNKDTFNDLKTLINGHQDTRWWSDLNNLKDVNNWVFDKGPYAVTPDMSVIVWSQEPDDTNHAQNCVALNYQGTISDERCADKHRYICEYQAPTGQQCLEGWYTYKNGCYLFPSGLSDPWSLLTWAAAKQKCENILPATPSLKPHLMFFETKAELNYTRIQLQFITRSTEIWWIGLNDQAQESNYVYTDGSSINTNNVVWAEEPNNLGGNERCAVMNRHTQFADLDCSSKEAYICIKESDLSLYQDMPGLGCPTSWTRAGQSCYLIETQQSLTWNDAKTACQQNGAHIVKIDTLDKKTWIESQTYVFDSGLWFWTGLNMNSNQQWQWADGAPANMATVKWNVEPNNYKGVEQCAVITKQGTFNDVGCILSNGFICEMNLEDSACPPGWIVYQDTDHTNCYYISDSMATYDEAHSQCKTLGFPSDAYLVAFNTKAELTVITKALASSTSNIPGWLTGLTDVGQEGVWGYDTTWNQPPPAGFIPWTKMPAFSDGDENCVAIIWGGQYINTKCTVKRPYICERPAVIATHKGASAGPRGSTAAPSQPASGASSKPASGAPSQNAGSAAPASRQAVSAILVLATSVILLFL